MARFHFEGGLKRLSVHNLAIAGISLAGAFTVLAVGIRTADAATRKSGERAPRAVGVDPALAKARQLFAKGTSLVRATQWAEALAAFEESNEIRPHRITTYNIGACERALGRYTAAEATLQKSLSPERGSQSTLPESLAGEAKAYMAEIERLLVRVDLTVAPADAAIAVDGRPLEATVRADGAKMMIAGRRPAGRGEVLPAVHGEILLDPGTRIFTLSRKGFSDQVVTKTFTPGTRSTLKLNLDKLPAKLRVSSNEERSVVRIEGADTGYAPVDVDRPSGAYNVTVVKPGFLSYDTTVRVNPGEAIDIKATLYPEKAALTRKWWFWTAAGVLVAGTVLTTYFATRSNPAPHRPPLDGGGLGWTIPVP